MTASYDWWQRAIAGEKIGGPTLPVHDGQAEVGFFRRRTSKGGGYIGVAIFEHEGQIVAVKGAQEADAAAEWSWCCRYPVTEEAYRQWESTGKWPDEDDSVTASLTPPPASQAPGANNPPADPLEDLRGSIETALAGVSDYAKVGTDEAASKAQSLRSRLLELSGTADKKRETLKRPYLEAGRAVDDAWNPLVKMAKAGADALRAAISLFETAEKNKRDAAEAERQKAIRLAAQEAEKARLEAEAAGKPAPEPPPPAPVPEPAPAPSTQVRGAYGKAASKKVVKVAAVTDQDALYPFLKTHKELIELMAALAQRAVTAGLNPPGVTVTEEVKIV